MKPFGLDSLLGSWPAQDPQTKGGPSWDERAEAITRAAVAQKDRGLPEIMNALTAPPQLEPEPGEDKAGSFQFHDGAADREQRSVRPISQSGAPQPMSSDQKKPSLKELAARASQAGAGRSSVTPLPPAARGSVPPGRASTPSPATVTPITRAKSARSSDAGREDSGVLRLADLQAQAAKPAPAEEPKPAADKPKVAAAAAPAPVIAKTVAAAPGGGSGSATGMWAGVAIGLLGIAAAFAVYRSRKPETPPPTAAVTDNAQKPQTAPVASDAPKPKQAEQPAAVASAEPAPAASDAPKADAPQNAGAAGAAGAAAPTGAVVAVGDKPAQAGTAAPKGGKVGSLEEEMKKSVGAESQPAPQDDSKPASGGSGGNVPDQPSQGNAQAAIRAVLPAARACVAGATENTSASITFGSSGSVQSVSVTGWAAANGKAGCVKSALQGAHVQPFARPTFTAPATIRP
jgi:hypothetical protein